MRGEDTHKDRVIRKLLASGAEVVVKKLKQNLTNDAAAALEIELIAQFGRRPEGLLVNSTLGGDGAVGYRHTAAAKELMRLARLGKPVSEAHRAAFVAAGQLVAWTPEVAAKRRKTLASPQVKAKMDAARRRPKSPAARANIAAAQQRPEVRQKISAALTGIKRTPKQKETHRRAILKWWQERRA